MSKASAKELKHMQDHNVFEVVWLGEIRSLPKVRAKWLQGAYGERDDVFYGHPLSLTVAHSQMALAPSRNLKGTRYIGLFDITAAFVHSRMDELIVLTPPVWIMQPCPGTSVETCSLRNAQSVEALGKNLLKEQRRVDSAQSFSRNTVPRVTVTIFLLKHRWQDWARSKQRYKTTTGPRGSLTRVPGETARAVLEKERDGGSNTIVSLLHVA